jgi:hypothetical protein
MAVTTDDPLFLAAGIASFDIVSGIRVIHRWIFSANVDISNLTGLFKIVLGNVHRQGEQYYSESSTSTVEMPTLNWFLVSSIFMLPNPKRQPIYYSVALVFNLLTLPTAPEFVDIIISWVRILTIVAKGLLGNSRPPKALQQIIDLISTDIAMISRASLSPPPEFDLFPSDAILYARLLTAHFQTQMTTVIESSSAKPEHAQHLARFLAHFSLPHQRRFSSLELLPHASPHLYIQCIESQGQAEPHESMLMFDRPVTWVQMPDRRDGHVRISKSDAAPDQLRALHEVFVRTHFVERELADDSGVNQRIGELRDRLKIQDIVAPAQWCVVRVGLLIETPSNARVLFCEEQMAALVRTGIALVAIVQTKGEDAFAAGEAAEKEVRAALRLGGAGDWEIAVAIARMYDRDIAGKLNVGRLATIRPFPSILGPRKN